MSDDPMHIDNVRARHAVDDAERSMYREIAKEIGPPKNTHFGLLRKALKQTKE